MIKFKSGNLIEFTKQGIYDVVLHGVNCHCKMSDGIALQFAQHFPSVAAADLKTVPLDKNKLGTWVAVPVNINDKKVVILNCYTQFNYAGYNLEEADLFDYNAFEKILKNISVKYAKKKIAMPLIGTGHAGGNMDRILRIIKNELSHNNVDVIVYSDLNAPKELYSLSNKLKCWLDF